MENFQKTKLTFANEKFILFKDGVKTEISDFEKAVRYREYADVQAEKILDRAFVKYYPVVYELPKFLDAHQKEGVKWILSRSRSYLAHAPGAGKTAQAIVASLFASGDGQTLFIVPPSLTTNWEREISKFLHMMGYHEGDFTVSVVPRSNQKDFTKWDSDFLIIPDSMITKRWVNENLKHVKKKFIAVDEASRFKEPTSQRSIYLFGGRVKDRFAPGIIRGAKHVVLMDGSPMPNRPMELWAPTYAMSPESIHFMSQNDFGFRYCGARMNDFGQWEFKGSSREDELKEKLQANFMHVVNEDRLNHPERRRSIVLMDKDVRSHQMKTWERENAGSMKLSDITETDSKGELASYRKQLGVKKVPFIAKYVRERLEAKNESILLFTWHREVGEELKTALKEFKPRLIIGDTDQATREEGFYAFQSGATRILIGNILAMGRGLNLQKADRVIFGEYAWSNETNLQAEKRASRKGRDQDLPVRCEYICCPDSLDEVILHSVMRKEERVKKVIG